MEKIICRSPEQAGKTRASEKVSAFLFSVFATRAQRAVEHGPAAIAAGADRFSQQAAHE